MSLLAFLNPVLLRKRQHAHICKPSFYQHRPLHFETLEDRRLLSADTYLVNFQHENVPVPTRYASDTGEVFSLQDNGWSYGWSSDHTDVSRDRESHPDQRLDTLIHFHQGQAWELEVSNGPYEVTVGIGDPSFGSTHTLNVEDTNFWNNVPLASGEFRFDTHQISVTDGRLTLDQGAAGDKATRINYVHVVGLANEPNSSPAVPALTEPTMEGELVNPTDFHMEAVGYSDTDGDEHLSTDWEIWRLGDSPERVWQTLGITGVERLHTHLGDGIFENSHAGRTDLISVPIPNLNFNTYSLTLPDVTAGDNLTIVAEMLDATGGAGSSISGMVDAFSLSTSTTGNLIDDGSFELASSGTQSSNSNWTMLAQSDGIEPAAQFQTATWAASKGTTGVWFKGFRGTAETPVDAQVSQLVTAPTDDDYTLIFDAKVEENFPDVIGGFRVTISSDGTGGSQTVDLLNSFAPEYELRVRYRDAAGAVSDYATRTFKVGAASTVFPLELEGIAASPAPTWRDHNDNTVIFPNASPNPSQLLLEGAQGELLLSFTGADGSSNSTLNPPGLEEHVELRLVLTAGSQGLNLGESETTYYGSAAQTQPDFTSLARQADLPIPFIAFEPGFEIDEVAGGFQLPVNIAFVPEPGPNLGDPLFYVNELYGTIKVVTNDFSVSEFASGLLNFNPTGAFPGSGEQGLAGIVVDPATGDLFVTRVTDTDGLPGGAHHPQVLRISSNDGGLTASSATVILDMVGETQGQSHQISNATIGPDGKLYIHNGDGFDASTALNLDSYRGKILRMNLDGSAPSDNPFYDLRDGINSRDYIYAYGFRNPFGGAWRAADGKHYEVENGNAIDRFARVESGGNYGWNGSDSSLLPDALYVWNPAHAPVNITFVQPETFGGSQFPNSKQDHAFVSESGPTYALGQQPEGKRIVEFELDANGNVIGSPSTLVEYVGIGRGTVSGLVAGPDGLYFTELYKDLDAETPIDSGARVFRVRFTAGGDADFDLDGDVDGRDFLSWQRGYGSQNAAKSDGDADNDDDVDAFDLEIWQNEFGSSKIFTSSSPIGSIETSLQTRQLVASEDSKLIQATNLWLELPLAIEEDFPEMLVTVEPLSAELLDKATTDIDPYVGSRFPQDEFSPSFDFNNHDVLNDDIVETLDQALTLWDEPFDLSWAQ